jgi:hypothetical protein
MVSFAPDWKPIRNPVVAEGRYLGATLRQYENGMYDAVDGPGFSISPGFDAEMALLGWIDETVREIAAAYDRDDEEGRR